MAQKGMDFRIHARGRRGRHRSFNADGWTIWFMAGDRPIRARKTSRAQISSIKKATAPDKTYKASPVSARVHVFIKRQSLGNTRFVRMINNAGRQTIS